MRIGAIFARGSCRALKWTALFGVVFALGAGSVLAQTTTPATVVNTTSSGAAWTRTEGQSLDVTFRINAVTSVASFTGVTANVVVDLHPSAPAGRSDTNGWLGLPSLAEAVDAPSVTVPITFGAVTGGIGTAVNATGSARLFIAGDSDAEDEIGNVRLLLFSGSTFDFTGLNLPDNSGPLSADTNFPLGVLTITDAHDQKFEWVSNSQLPTAAAGGPTEGQATASIQVRAVPAPVDYTWEVQARSDDSRYPVLAADTIAFPIPGTPRRINIDTERHDGDRADTDVMLTLYRAGTDQRVPEEVGGADLDPHTFKVKDIHKLPAATAITWKAYTNNPATNRRTNTETDTIVEGGAPIHVRVSVARGDTGYPSGEMLEVTPMVTGSADRLDYRLDNVPIDIASGSGTKHAEFMVRALEDKDVGAEDLELDLVVKGKTAANGSRGAAADNMVTAAKAFKVRIQDETDRLLEPKSATEVDDVVAAARTSGAAAEPDQTEEERRLWTPGEELTIMRRQLFDSTSAVQLSASSSDSSVRAEASGDAVTLTAMSVGTATITVTGTVLSSATVTQTRDNIASVEFDVTVDELPLKIMLEGPEDMDIAEGDSVVLTARANRAVTANTTVELRETGDSTASPADWNADNITINAGESTGTTRLTVVDDSEVEGMETLTLEGRFGASKTEALTFNLMDNDEEPLLITPKSDETVMTVVGAARATGATADGNNLWTMGEIFDLTAGQLFDSAEDGAVALSGSSSGEAVFVSATGSAVRLRADAVGTATITITGTVTGDSVGTQISPNSASVTFDVTVDALPLAELEITLEGPADMNVAEGMSAMVTARANRPVTENTTVELLATGGSASPGDWNADNIMIMAGETTATTMLMAVEDNMEEPMEMLTIEGRVGSMKTNSLTFNLWDAAVPALPVIAQLLLAAFLAIGGYRRYLRR